MLVERYHKNGICKGLKEEEAGSVYFFLATPSVFPLLPVDFVRWPLTLMPWKCRIPLWFLRTHSHTPALPHFLKALEVLSELRVPLVGNLLAVAAVLGVLLLVQEPLRDVVVCTRTRAGR